MAVVVPATAHPSHVELANKITTLTTAITNAASNGKLAYDLTKLKSKAQLDLVLSLLGSGKILASNVLANETYAAGQEGGDQP